MNVKEAANKLLALAEAIEKEASENTYFVCEGCNHTSTLADINSKRRVFASENNMSDTLTAITVNDKVACPACSGVMSYVASNASSKFYVMAEDIPEGDETDSVSEDEEEKAEETPDSIEEVVPSEEETTEEEISDEAPESDSEDIDIDKLFEDVETQAQKAKGESGVTQEDKPGDTSSALPPDSVEEEKPEEVTEDIEKGEEVSEEPGDGEEPVEDVSDEEVNPEGDIAPEEAAPDEVAPEEVPEEEVVEESDLTEEEIPKKKKDKPDDGKVNLEKEDVPQFKSKEAIDRFAASYQRYSL